MNFSDKKTLSSIILIHMNECHAHVNFIALISHVNGTNISRKATMISIFISSEGL